MTEAEAITWLGGHGTGNMSLSELKGAYDRALDEKAARCAEMERQTSSL